MSCHCERSSNYHSIWHPKRGTSYPKKSRSCTRSPNSLNAAPTGIPLCPPSRYPSHFAHPKSDKKLTNKVTEKVPPMSSHEVFKGTTSEHIHVPLTTREARPQPFPTQDQDLHSIRPHRSLQKQCRKPCWPRRGAKCQLPQFVTLKIPRLAIAKVLVKSVSTDQDQDPDHHDVTTSIPL